MVSTLDTYHILSPLPSCAGCFYPHFTDEETDSERLLNLSVVTQLRVLTEFDSDGHAFSLFYQVFMLLFFKVKVYNHAV